MQLKYNREPSLSNSLGKLAIKLILIIAFIIIAIFLIEKISFPTPEKNYKIDITNEIIKLK
jgi:flagellar biogenesis protein FliO|tara:strand:- start:1598 stop:1780 length:183 start_codon:yes stop_codon:yes gene_type:complete